MLTLLHKVPELKTDSLCMFMADVTDLLTGYRHVCNPGVSIDQADPELNMYMLSKHLLIEYGAVVDTHAATLEYHEGPDPGTVLIEVSANYRKKLVRLPNAPPMDKFSALRKMQKMSTSFNLGVFFGEKKPRPDFLEQLAYNKPEWCTLLFTSGNNFTMPAVYERLIREHSAVPCRFGAGAMNRYLGWADAIAVDHKRIPERICAEANAAAVPVITGDVNDILETVKLIKSDREQYNKLRRHALEIASRNDMTCAIASLIYSLEGIMSWKNTTNSLSEQVLHPVLTHAEACI